MFNIGGGEFFVIALIALIVLGPQRLPGAARQAGKVMGDLRRMSSGFQSELKGALADAEADDRATARRNPLGNEPLAPALEVEPTPPLAAAIQAVSAQSAQAAATPTKPQAIEKAPAKKAPAKKAPAKKAPAKKAPAKKAAAPTAPATKAAAKQAPAKKAAAKKAAAKKAVSNAAPRRTPKR